MSKQQKKSDSSHHQALPRLHQKILPHKRHFITFQSDYDYGDSYDVIPCLIKNPKWCHLQLKLGHTGAFKKYKQLRRAKSLRLRSLHLESFSLDSQMGEDGINGYFGELDTLSRAGHTLKNLSLSVTLDDDLVKRYNREDVYHRLEKFVKKQKHLDEFAFYNGTRKNPKRIADWLKHLERTLKVLTIENLSVDNLFTKYSFPKLETLRFEYILFYGSERSFDLSIIMKCFEQIFSLCSLQALKFVQYQRYNTQAYYEIEGEDEDEDGIEGEDGENEMKIENEKIDENEGDDDEENKDNQDENYSENSSGDQATETQGPDVEAVAPNVWKISGNDGLAKLFDALTKSCQKEAEERYKIRQRREKKYDMTKLQEFPIEFWEVLRETLDKNKKKPLKVKYHKQDESNIKKMEKEFERIFKGLSGGQSFEYEVRQIESFDSSFGWKFKTKTLNNFIFM